MVGTFSRVGADGCVVMRASILSSRISFCSRRKYVLATWAMIRLISAELRGCLLSDMFLLIVKSKEEGDVIKLHPKSKGSKAIMPPRMRTRSVGRSVAESREGGTGGRVGRGGGRGRGPREGNDERIDELNGQGNDQGLGANGGVEGVNGNVDRVNGGIGGAPDFLTIIA
ncbi:hypothetical protein Tco_0157313 [Tanacetum coccineum]